MHAAQKESELFDDAAPVYLCVCLVLQTFSSNRGIVVWMIGKDGTAEQSNRQPSRDASRDGIWNGESMLARFRFRRVNRSMASHSTLDSTMTLAWGFSHDS